MDKRSHEEMHQEVIVDAYPSGRQSRFSHQHIASLVPLLKPVVIFALFLLFVGGVVFFIIDRRGFLAFMALIFEWTVGAGVVIGIIYAAFRFGLGSFVVHVLGAVVDRVIVPLRHSNVYALNDHFIASAQHVRVEHHEDVRYNVRMDGVPSAPQIEAPVGLPGPCDFSNILETWRPSQHEILLGLGTGGRRIVTPLRSLCHVALAGSTGGGKSSLMRLLLPQLEYVGAKVALADPHFAPIDIESGDDWRLIASRLAIEPAVSYQAILDLLEWLSKKELPTRLKKRNNAEPVGEPFFLGIDELPAIVKHLPETPELMADLLREGRKVGLYLISAAQDWLVSTIGGKGAVRDCFRTAFYVGGDTTSARVLLDITGRVDDGGLGKGVVMLRSYPTPQASLVRVPWASNGAIEGLLDLADSTDGPRRNTVILDPNPTDAVAHPWQNTRNLDARSLRVRDLVKAGMSQSKIIEEVWGVTAKTGGDTYRKAARELSDILASLIS